MLSIFPSSRLFLGLLRDFATENNALAIDKNAAKSKRLTRFAGATTKCSNIANLCAPSNALNKAQKSTNKASKANRFT